MHVSLFFSLGLLIFCLSGCKSAEDYNNEAALLEEQGKYQEAIKLLDKAIEKDPEYLSAYINRGVDKSFLEDYRGAIMDYKKVIVIDPANTLGFFNIGHSFYNMNLYDSSIYYYSKAFETKGGSMIYMDYIENSFVNLEKAKWDVPGHEISYERALAYYEVDSLSKVVSDMNNCIENNYKVPEAYYMIALAWGKSGNKEKMCKYIQTSAKFGYGNAIDAMKADCSE